MFEKKAEEYFKKRYPNNIAINSYYVEGFNDSYNKANEWHYVKDGDLPKGFGYFLVALKHNAYKGFVLEVAYFTGSIFTKDGEVLDNAFAWKEIVSPELKEIKENDSNSST